MSRYFKKEWDNGTLDGLEVDSGLRAWLEQNGFVRYGSSKGCDYTCTFLNGGTALIPDDKYDTFLQLMAAELDANRPWSVHENATRISRLYFDLDIVESRFDLHREIDIKKMRDWVYTLQCAVYDFFPGAMHRKCNPDKISQVGGRAIVLMAPCAFETRQKKKTGTAAAGGGGGSGGGAGALLRTKSATPREAERVALAQRVGSGSAPNQSAVLAHMRRDREESSEPTYTVRKTGLHIVFPNIVCDLNEMLEVRAHVVARLTEEHAAPGDKSWADIVDEQVYTGSAGLRLAGTMKVETCKTCRGDARRRKTCDACNGRPRTFVERAYTPAFVHTTFGGRSSKTMRDMKQSYESMLRQCSIRQVHAHKTCPPFVRPSVAKPYTGPKIQYAIDTPSANNASWTNAKRLRVLPATSATTGARKRKNASGAKGAETPQSIAALRSNCASGSKVINVFASDHEVCQMLEQFIRTHTYAQWKQIVVSEVRQVLLPANARFRTPGTIYLINVSESSPRHCLNVGGEHRSRSIYFVAKRSGIEQRCFCRCETTENRISGVPCGEFRSNVCDFLQFSLGRRIQERLFPSGNEQAHTHDAHARYGSSARTPTSTTAALFEVQRTPDPKVRNYPSLADVRRDTERKRRAAGLSADEDVCSEDSADSGRGANDLCVGNSALQRPADGSVPMAELARIDHETRVAEEENPNFAPIAALECSYTPDICTSTPSLARALTNNAKEFGADAVSQQTKRHKKRQEAATFVTLPLREPPRSVQQYKRAVKNAQKAINASTCEQIDRFLQK